MGFKGGKSSVHADSTRSGNRAMASACLLLACGSDPEAHSGFEFGASEVWSSEHFRYHVRPGDTGACREVLETLEARAAQLSAYLGADPASWAPVDYFKFQNLEALTASGVCRTKDARACYQQKKIYSEQTSDEHELAHAIAAPFGDPPLLTEGLAVALSCSPRPRFGSRFPSWQDAYEYGDYQHAGAFVSELVDRFGIESFVRLYRSISPNASADDFASAFRSEYGVEV